MKRICVGVPVFNGERFISDCLESILTQTFEDFELIVLDNDSSDGTPRICEDFARRDSRVLYRRNEKNLGAPGNFNKVFALSNSQYFKWAAADDMLEPQYLERCVDVLDAEKGVVACHTKTRIIDDAGTPTKEYISPLSQLGSSSAAARFTDFVLSEHACFDVFGLMRTDAVSRTRLIGSYVSADRNLLAELSLMGRFHTVPEVLFLSRDHGDRSVRIPERQGVREWWGQRGTLVFPYWRLLAEYSSTVSRADVSWHEKASCYGALLEWSLRHHRHLGSDLKSIARRAFDLAGGR